MDELVTAILTAAKARNVMIATAESCTGGMIAAALTDQPGSSAIFERGFVTYSNEAKIELLGVDPITLSDHGAVSEATAREMAQGALRNSRATIAVSVTGIAGPGGSEFKPEGRVCFGLASEGHETHAETVDFGAPGRDQVRSQATLHALKLLQSALAD